MTTDALKKITTDAAHDNAQSDQSPKQDVYARITAKIVAALEDGVRPWVRPWNAEHAAGRIAYSGHDERRFRAS